MKYIKTFDQFINESTINEDQKLTKTLTDLVQKFNRSGISLKKMTSEILSILDVPENRENISRVENFLNDRMIPRFREDTRFLQEIVDLFESKSTNSDSDIVNERKEFDKDFVVKNGFTFTTVDNKKFTIPRKAEIEVTGFNSTTKTTMFKITKGKLDGYPADKRSEFEVTIKDFNDFDKDGDIECIDESIVNEAVNKEGDAKVLSFVNRLAKDWDITPKEAVNFIQSAFRRIDIKEEKLPK